MNTPAVFSFAFALGVLTALIFVGLIYATHKGGESTHTKTLYAVGQKVKV